MKRLSSVFFALILVAFTTAAYANGEISEIHSHCVCGVNDCMSGHGETANWQAWNGDTSVGTASGDTETTKYLYLENDVTVTSTLDISNVTVYLCLNGNTLTKIAQETRLFASAKIKPSYSATARPAVKLPVQRVLHEMTLQDSAQ